MSDAATWRLGFAGTPEFAAQILNTLLTQGLRPQLILTQPDRPRGRGRRHKPSPVKQLALTQGLVVHQPMSLKQPEDLALLHSLDLLIVAAYGLLLPPAALSIPRMGCINVHASLLPRWRGAAPVERAIMAGDKKTGITLMQMDAGLDTGDIIAQSSLPISATDTGRDVHDALAALGSKLLIESLPDLENLPRIPQSECGVTYAAKLTTDDAWLDWRDRSIDLANRIRALNNRLPAYSYLMPGDAGATERVRLLSATAVPGGVKSSSNAPDTRTDKPGLPEPATPEPGTIIALEQNAIQVATSDGYLTVNEVQLVRGKGKVMSVRAARNGYPDFFRVGARFESRHST